MAYGAVTGATVEELEAMRAEFRETPLHEDHGIPFETAYCLQEIGKQPDDYDGPTRYCRKRAAKLTEQEWVDAVGYVKYEEFDERAYHPSCNFHGRSNGGNNVEDLEEVRLTANLKHGLHATDEHLHMDFTDEEQALYDFIVEEWPDIYDWPPRDEDPARYLLLEKVATNFVRTERCEEYLDENNEVVTREVFNEEGVQVGEEDEENPLARPYRLLVREVRDMLNELGLTPKEQARQDIEREKASASDAIGDLASAVTESDREYDPSEFEGGAGAADREEAGGEDAG